MLVDSLLPTTFWAEAVSTACYVQNRVLMTKPHNKTPYELLHGRPPGISFMRPFGCPVTILNTLDPLGKFDGKADEGLFVRYSINSKAFRVFNTRTRKVEENLHITFLENKPNVAGSGPDWLFDIDLLTNSMHYERVTAGNQTNRNSLKDGVAGDAGKKTNKEPTNEGERNGQEKEGGALNKEDDQNVQDFRAALDNLLVPQKQGYVNKADLNNLETTMNVSPIPTTRIHKDHPKDQIIGDINSAIQTRRMINFSEENAMVSYISKQRRTNHKDYQNCLFAYFLSQIEPKKVIQALTDPSWIEAMQEELLQFKLQKVWTLVDLLKSKRAIGTKIEAIRLFLAYASFMGFIVYQMDVKSAFLYGTIEKRRCMCANLLALKIHSSLIRFIRWKKLYMVYIKLLEPASTPTETNKALIKDEEAENVESQFNLVSYKAGLESVEARLAHYKKNEVVFEESINDLNLEVKLRDNALVENKKKLEKAEKERDELKLTLEEFKNSSKSLNNLLESQVSVKFKTGIGYKAASSTAASPAVESFVNSSEMLENQENNKSKSEKGYHAVPPPL
ncbi:putative ribonuclease H-like domain-containing protein [Tanacetum coccineum]